MNCTSCTRRVSRNELGGSARQSRQALRFLRGNFQDNQYNPLHNGGMLKWMASPEARNKANAARDSAWDDLTKKFPNADRSKFVAQVEFAKSHTGSAEIFFKDSPTPLQSVFGSDRKYWSQRMKTALGVAQAGGFPYQLGAMKTKRALPIPPIDFTEPAQPLKNLLSGEFKIYAAPDQFIVTQFRNVFQKTRLKHKEEKEAKAWLAGPKMKYWPQQLNFAVFCATQACGISRQIFDSGLALAPQIRTFYQFHVHFTIRRVLLQLGGIHRKNALPGDPTLNPLDNPYDEAAYDRLCPLERFPVQTRRVNHGLGAYLPLHVRHRRDQQSRIGPLPRIPRLQRQTRQLHNARRARRQAV